MTAIEEYTELVKDNNILCKFLIYKITSITQHKNPVQLYHVTVICL